MAHPVPSAAVGPADRPAALPPDVGRNPHPTGGTRHACPAQALGIRSAFVRPLGVGIVAHCDMRYTLKPEKMF
jgi:hypothetical protein